MRSFFHMHMGSRLGTKIFKKGRSEFSSKKPLLHFQFQIKWTGLTRPDGTLCVTLSRRLFFSSYWTYEIFLWHNVRTNILIYYIKIWQRFVGKYNHGDAFPKPIFRNFHFGDGEHVTLFWTLFLSSYKTYMIFLL